MKKPQGRVHVPEPQPGVKWTSPPAGVAKIHVDAAFSRSAEGGAIAAISRDEMGNYMGASAISIPEIVDFEILEAMATNEALCLLI